MARLPRGCAILSLIWRRTCNGAAGPFTRSESGFASARPWFHPRLKQRAFRPPASLVWINCAGNSRLRRCRWRWPALLTVIFHSLLTHPQNHDRFHTFCAACFFRSIHAIGLDRGGCNGTRPMLGCLRRGSTFAARARATPISAHGFTRGRPADRVIDDANPFVSAYAIQNAGSAFRYPCERFLRDSLGGAAPYSLWTDAQLYGDCRSDRRAAGRARGRERLREKSARADYALPSRDSEEWPTGRLSLGRGAQSRASSA